MRTLKYILSYSLVLLMAFSCSDDNNLDYLDNVTAPSNISALFQVTQDNTGLVTIIPNSTGAVKYNITLGDSTPEPEVVNQGQSLEHIYAEGTYSVTIEAVGITGLKSQATKELVVSFKAPENLNVVISNDEAVSKQVNVFATADYAISFDVYFGEEGNDTPISANIGEIASYVYQEPGIYTIRVVVKSAAIETTEYVEEFEATEILQPIASAPTPPTRIDSDVISLFSSRYNDVAGTNFFPDWGQGGQGSGWAMFDLNGDQMLQYINLSYQGIALADGITVDVSNMDYIHLDVWTAGGTSKIETSLINNDNGTVTEKPIMSDLTAGEWTSIDIPISAYTDQGLAVNNIFQLKFVGNPWAAGTVFIDNIYFWKEPQIATAPDVAAPDPTFDASNVVSIFSNTYTSVGISELNPGWGQSTTLTNVSVAGNDMWLYESLNYTGIVTDYGNPTNLSAMNFVHFDYFTPDANKLGLKLVNTNIGQEDLVFLSSIVKGTWVSVTIPLSNYNMDRSAVSQLLFDTDGGSAKVYIDNLYFYSENDSTQPTVQAPIPTIGSSDVVSIYSDSYTTVGISELNPGWGQSTTLTEVNIGGNNIWKYESLNYTGIVTDYGNPTDLSAMSYVHFDYFAPNDTQLGLKIVNTVLGEEDLKFVEVVTGTWVSVTIPLDSYAIDRSAVTQLLFDSNGGSSTVYIDNLYFHN